MSLYIISEIIHYCNIKVRQNSSIPPETINYYDLTFVLRGKLTYTVDGREHILQKNDALLIPPGSVRTRKKDFETVEYVSFNFRTQNIQLAMPTYMKNVISTNIRTLLSVFPDNHLSDEKSLRKCAAILNIVLAEIDGQLSRESQNHHVQKMLDYIHTNFNNPIVLTDLAGCTYLSPEYCSWLFKKEMGEAPISYINRYKMKIAKNLAAQREMSLHDISRYLGYENYNYFSRLFKRYHSVAPTKYMLHYSTYPSSTSLL